MMIADLIDQDDFFQRLINIGVRLEPGWTSEQCSQAAIIWFSDADLVQKEHLRSLVKDLQQHQDLMLPEVREALKHLSDGCIS